MKKRLITSAVIVVVYAVAFLLQTVAVVGPYLFDLLLLVACYFAITEVLKARKNENINKYYVYAYLVLAYFLFVVVAKNASVWIHLLLQILFFAVMILYVTFVTMTNKKLAKHCSLQKIDFKKQVGDIVKEYMFNFAYPGLLLLGLSVINHMDFFMKISAGINVGLFGILMVFVISCLTDVFAYVVGISFKGPKLLPQKMQYISPNKTISGAVGGLIGGLIASLIVLACFVNTEFSDFLYTKFNSQIGIYLGIIVIGIIGSIFNQIGDIYASFLKRKSGIKDFGTIMPGHGGFMDRLDGVAFNTVFILIAMLIIFI